ncbi:MAG: hydroxyisourate hydrolase [Comamonadaceae bacterium]|jgi:5-hydroxyisourate hydrolase|nr:hydroxyisourate hydrolase [Comamonadaceae bacterium]
MPLRAIAPWLLAAGLAGLVLPAQAADPNPLSVHVLNLQTGQPSPGIRVDLERRVEAGQWQALGSGVTDEQGRIRALVPADALGQWSAGEYRVVFRTGEFYARQQQPSFFPEIPVVFRVDSAKQHYHVPLLLSPFGFSTYRGN